jgi:alkylation response protein AidB-like acyl-CoA dehydrogenase
MDFAFNEEQERFRQEVADFCHAELEDRPRTPEPASAFVRKVAQKGWLGINIPQEYRGLGKNATHRVIFNEEMAYHRAPISLTLYGRSFMLFGKICLKHGSEQMKRKWLPLLASGRTVIGQSYTEPEAGTDLTRIQTRAVREGDHYVVNGQKMFITTTHVLPYELLLAKTVPDAPPEKAFSMFIMENKAPGVSHSPLMGLGGYRTNQVFLDNVKIPAENLVGEENQGYKYYLENKPFYLNKELGAIVGDLRRCLEDTVQYCKSTLRNGHPLASFPKVRQGLASFAASIRAMRNLSYRMAWMEDHGLDLFHIGTVVRIFTVETRRAFNDFAVRLPGRSGLLEPGSEDAPFGGMMAWRYQYDGIENFTRGSPSYTKSYLATHELGMPEY